jgi:hypothetical protein
MRIAAPDALLEIAALQRMQVVKIWIWRGLFEILMKLNSIVFYLTATVPNESALRDFRPHVTTFVPAFSHDQN